MKKEDRDKLTMEIETAYRYGFINPAARKELLGSLYNFPIYEGKITGEFKINKEDEGFTLKGAL